MLSVIFRLRGQDNKSQRLAAYKALFKAHIDNEEPGVIRASWQTGTPLGNDYFKQKVEDKLKCNVGQARRGRPLKGSNPNAAYLRVKPRHCER
jgi:hypothetical protein